mgnify:CR=1 FL=1
MMVNTNNLVSLTEANRNFSKVARLVDERGSAVILKNNAPRYRQKDCPLLAPALHCSELRFFAVLPQLVQSRCHEVMYAHRSAEEVG